MSNTNSLTHEGLLVPPPPHHRYHVAAILRFQHVRVLSSPSRQRRRPITLLHSLPHSLSLSAPHLLCIAHHSFISWWPSKKKPNKNSFSARGASLLLIAGVRMPRCRGQFLRTNQSFNSSTPSNCIHQLYPTHSIHILCNFFIRDFFFPRAK